MNSLPPLPAGDTQAFSKEFHGVSYGMVFRVPKASRGTDPARENFTGYYLPPGDTKTVRELVAYYVRGEANGSNSGLTREELEEHHGHPISGDWTTKQRAAPGAKIADLPQHVPVVTPRGALF